MISGRTTTRPRRRPRRLLLLPWRKKSPYPLKKLLNLQSRRLRLSNRRQMKLPEKRPMPAGMGTVESFTESGEDIFEKPLPGAAENTEVHPGTVEVIGLETGEAPASPSETEEMSLEFAFKKISDLESEVQKREFQFDELLNLMMKKELGEITTDLFMKELITLKQEMEKRKTQKK